MSKIVKAEVSIPPEELAQIRGRAINSYALLEQSLCGLLATFSNMPNRAAATIFFKIGNARYRNEILDKLKKQTLRTQYAKFWNSALKMVGSLDTTRNQIVHWHVVTKLGPNDNDSREVVLLPPNFWAYSQDTPEITLGNLITFIRKTDFLSGSLNHFRIKLDSPEELADDSPWHQILEQELTYPPPHNHPLARTGPKS